jgi:hypothetical protein
MGSNKRKQTFEYWLQILKFTHEGAEEKQRYSSTLSSTSARNGDGSQRQFPAGLPPGKRSVTHSQIFLLLLLLLLVGPAGTPPIALQPSRPFVLLTPDGVRDLC